MKQIKNFALVLTAIYTVAAFAGCDDGGLQDELRRSANALHPSEDNIHYIDFADDAPFSGALLKMKKVGVSNAKVQAAWADAIKKLCGDKADLITPDKVGPTQTLSGLELLLKVTP